MRILLLLFTLSKLSPDSQCVRIVEEWHEYGPPCDCFTHDGFHIPPLWTMATLTDVSIFFQSAWLPFWWSAGQGSTAQPGVCLRSLLPRGRLQSEQEGVVKREENKGRLQPVELIAGSPSLSSNVNKKRCLNPPPPQKKNPKVLWFSCW